MSIWNASKRGILPEITDYHTHILPGIDDGARTVEESIKLLYLAQKCGVRTIYATPHFYGHRTDVRTFCERRQEAYEKIKNGCPEISICMGAEVLVFPGLERLYMLDQLVLGNTNALLLEFPLSESLITEQHFMTVESLGKRFRLVMAHANRYAQPVVEQMLEMGAILQVNGYDVRYLQQRNRICRWQQMGAEVLLGSDTHRDEKSLRYLMKAKRYISEFDSI